LKCFKLLLRNLNQIINYISENNKESRNKILDNLLQLENHIFLITIPYHAKRKIGTLNNIILDLADYLKIDKEQPLKDLFE
jgi:hypothetical protein